MGIKQHAHVVNTMAPIPFMEVYDIETCMWNMGKEKGFLCIVANF
jgi:hypothetical protein